MAGKKLTGITIIIDLMESVLLAFWGAVRSSRQELQRVVFLPPVDHDL